MDAAVLRNAHQRTANSKPANGTTGQAPKKAKAKAMRLETTAVPMNKCLRPLSDKESFGRTSHIRSPSVCAAIRLIYFPQLHRDERLIELDLT
jgi:hypothetical protein